MNTNFLNSLTNFLKKRTFEFVGLLLISLGIALTISFATYSPSDPSLIYGESSSNINNFFGIYGSKISDFLLQSFGLISFLILTNLSLYGERSGFEYLNSSILYALSNHFAKIDISAFLFGSGPIIDSNRYKFFPENFVIDVGILRVFLENGLLIFIFFASILIYFLIKNYRLAIKFPSNFNRSLLYILLVLLSMVHSNWFITPPFMVIYAIVISGILVQYKLSKRIKTLNENQ